MRSRQCRRSSCLPKPLIRGEGVHIPAVRCVGALDVWVREEGRLVSGKAFVVPVLYGRTSAELSGSTSGVDVD